MLLEVSSVSKSWREATIDSRLWKQKFHLEGWRLNYKEIQSFERHYNAVRLARVQRADTPSVQGRPQKRMRIKSESLENLSSIKSSNIIPAYHEENHAWNSVQNNPAPEHAIETDNRSSSVDKSMAYDADMHSVATSIARTQLDRNLSPVTDHQHLPPNIGTLANGKAMNEMPLDTPILTPLDVDANSPSQLMMDTASGYSTVDYRYLFKQKRKLENNWNQGSYHSFQLPHRDHPEEAHTECVYTIQYNGNHLVSGSRDRSLRIWNLETQRLIREPLVGHTASVLCLQFDDREEEDIIISGSSDTDVILWQFSTGKMLRKIPQAHRESVLNLKFDHRYLVTCSKDKTIKIWNRHWLGPGDNDYPKKGVPNGGKCPAYILDLTALGDPRNIENILAPGERKPLKPYTPLMLIDSHGAAVNAIHIYQNQLVSASGDRSVKVFDIHTGACIANCNGHTKGIACVQYDGKRIVSGSSDNTIRIYDPATQAEVACLQGHTRLVRTIQSAFGDLPGSSEQLEDEASEVDRQYFEAKRLGRISSNPEKTRERNDGSKDPNNIMAIGAKLPPGGGGGKWGRIVSGSYDETIIIWKKTSDGSWKLGHRLRQEEALRAAGGPLTSPFDLQARNQPPQGLPPIDPGPDPLQTNATHNPIHTNTQGIQNVMPMPLVQSSNQNPTQIPIGGIIQAQTDPYASSSHPFANPQGLAIPQPPHQNQSQNHPQQHVPPVTTVNLPATPWMTPAITAQLASLQPYHQHYIQNLIAAARANTQALIPNSLAVQPSNSNPAVALSHQATATVPQPNARVFKLQFDARRIICCSQDPKIVGWDFANGDQNIIESSRFFAAPQ